MLGRRYISVAFTLLATLLAISATQGAVVLTSVKGWPNERPFFQGDTPPNAIDGNINTYTWTTASGNSANPSYLGVGFNSEIVDRIRLWKVPDSGFGFTPNIKDLVIQFTNDSVGTPLDLRVWQTVSGLTNGYFGIELMNATSVNANGSVTGDVHNSPNGDGWASLSFDKVHATAMRIAFTVPSGQPINHYRVGEFQVYAAVPEPATVIAFLASFLFVGIACRVLKGSKPATQSMV
jgi:hypothetical protein